MSRLWNYSGRYKKHLALLPVIVLIGTFVELSIPYIMGGMLDDGLYQKNMQVILRSGLRMITASLVLVAGGIFESYLVSVWSTGFTKNIRDKLFGQIQELSASDIDAYGSASILTRMSTDMNFIKNALGTYNSLIRCPVTILCTVVITARVYPFVSWIFITAAALFGSVMIFIVRASLKHYGKMFQRYDALNAVLEENIAAQKTVKAYAREEQEKGRFRESAGALKREATISQEITVLSEPFLHLVMNICILILTYAGGRNIIAGNMQAGDFFCVVSYVTQILVQIYIVSLILVPIISANVSLNRIFEIVERVPSVRDAGRQDTARQDGAEIKAGEIVFDSVSFNYLDDKEKNVLSDIDLLIKPGEFIGVIGPSGAGKTTFISLIPRFYDVSGGSISIGGRDIRSMCLKKLRKAVGFVPQRSLLFTGTIKENLLWGAEDATDEDIRRACLTADADSFISAFPDGYETTVGQGGSTVSGGQRQRLCIARALLRKPPILILDDSLSAVDNTTEQNILKALSEEYSSSTVILVSQKFSSVKNADRIVVLSEGGIDGVGTHDELLVSSTVYRELYETQKNMMD